MNSNDTRKPPPDEYARGSFTWRRMTKGQIVGLIIAAVVVLIALAWWDRARAAPAATGETPIAALHLQERAPVIAA